MIALGTNLLPASCNELQTLHQPIRDKEKEKRHLRRSKKMFWKMNHIWAANCIDTVLAHKGCISEARDIFAQVIKMTMLRLFTFRFTHLWIVEGSRSHCRDFGWLAKYCAYFRGADVRKLHSQIFSPPNVEILQYLAPAHFWADKLREAKLSLLKAHHDTAF